MKNENQYDLETAEVELVEEIQEEEMKSIAGGVYNTSRRIPIQAPCNWEHAH